MRRTWGAGDGDGSLGNDSANVKLLLHQLNSTPLHPPMPPSMTPDLSRSSGTIESQDKSKAARLESKLKARSGRQRQRLLQKIPGVA